MSSRMRNNEIRFESVKISYTDPKTGKKANLDQTIYGVESSDMLKRDLEYATKKSSPVIVSGIRSCDDQPISLRVVSGFDISRDSHWLRHVAGGHYRIDGLALSFNAKTRNNSVVRVTVFIGQNYGLYLPLRAA